MAGSLRVVSVCRANIAESRRFVGLAPRSKMVWMWTMTMLCETKENDLRGCLCCGSAPMSFDEWRGECGLTRVADARSTWDELFRRGLFEWVEVDGSRYVRVARFTQNQERGRKNGAAKVAGRSQDFDRTSTGLRHEFAKNLSKCEMGNVDSKEVTKRISEKSLQEDVNVDHVNVEIENVDVVNVEGVVTAAGVCVGGLLARQGPRVESQRSTATATIVQVGDIAREVSARFEPGRVGCRPNGNGNGNGIGRAGHASEAPNTNAGVTKGAMPKRKVAAYRERLIDRIEEITGDRHSRGNWARLVSRLCDSATGHQALVRVVCDLQGRVNEARNVPERKGAWLNAALTKACVEVGLESRSPPACGVSGG